MANPVLNPSFEDPGAAEGQAASWTEVYPEEVPTAAGGIGEEVATFTGDDETTPYEGFSGGWLNNELAQTGFGIADVVSAFFEDGSLPYENFETTWILPEIADLSHPVWVHQSQMAYWHENFEPAYFDTGSYTAEGPEDFEEGWSTVENAVADLAAAVTSFASFDAAADTFEDFEEEWQNVEDAVSDFNNWPANENAMFDAATHAYENFEGSWPLLVYP